jgi:hypothetical protein
MLSTLQGLKKYGSKGMIKDISVGAGTLNQINPAKGNQC